MQDRYYHSLFLKMRKLRVASSGLDGLVPGSGELLDQPCPEDSVVRRLWARMCLPHGSHVHSLPSLPDTWESESVGCSVVSDSL